MAEEKEIEFKNLLNEQEYRQLLQAYCNLETPFFVQTNHYFDTPDWKLKKQHMGLRIRLKEAYAEYTLKSPLDDQQGLLETTEVFSNEKANELINTGTLPQLGEVADKLKTFKISVDSLRLIGSLKTKRCEIKLDDTHLLVLDESWYGNCHDYELELETVSYDEGKRYFNLLLDKHHLIQRPVQNKVVRMIEATHANDDRK